MDLEDTEIYRTTLEQLEEAQSALARLKQPTGKYVCLRKDYLKTYRPEYYKELTEKGSLNRHLLDISDRAYDLIDRQVERWKQADPEFQAAYERGDYMKLVGLTNNFTASAEEIAFKQIIYV